MSKHTEGEWSVSDDSIVTDDYCIATVETDGGYEAPEREDNKKLIAAAPNLLEAAQQALAYMDDIRARWGDEAVLKRRADQLRAAIAKAGAP